MTTNELRWLKILIRMFNCFGLVTFSVVSKSERVRFVGSRLAVLYNLVFAGFIWAINYFTFYTLYALFRATLTMYHIIDFFEIFFGTFVSSMILVSFCLQQGRSIKMTEKICRLKVVTSQMSLDRRKNSTSLSLAFIVLFHLVVTAATIVITALDSNYIFLLSSTLRNFIITWMVLQYGIVVKVLCDMFANVNEALLGMLYRNRTCASIFISGNDKLHWLSSVRDLHESLLEVCKEVIKFYELTIFGCISYIFVCLVVFSYVLIGIVIDEHRDNHATYPLNELEITFCILWLICFTSSFVGLSRFVTRTINEIDMTGIIVRQLIRNTLNNEILNELEDFSLNLLHSKVKFTAWGFFVLDGSLVRSIFSTITTYLVILVQFQMGYSSTSEPRSEHQNETLSS